MADHIAWRVEHYEKMGFNYAESVTLANTNDDKGCPVYWGDVANLLTATKWNHALTLDMLVALPPEPMMEFEDELTFAERKQALEHDDGA